MTQNGLHHVYTDAPELHPNLFLGSLHLLFWLLFHPSAWQHHIARIDPTLRPDFCLAELQKAQWRHPAMRRLLVQGNIVLPVLASTLTALILWSYGTSYELVGRGVAVSVAGGIAGGMAYGLAASVAGGVVASVVGGVTVGVEVGVRAEPVKFEAE